MFPSDDSVVLLAWDEGPEPPLLTREARLPLRENVAFIRTLPAVVVILGFTLVIFGSLAGRDLLLFSAGSFWPTVRLALSIVLTGVTAASVCSVLLEFSEFARRSASRLSGFALACFMGFVFFFLGSFAGAVSVFFLGWLSFPAIINRLSGLWFMGIPRYVLATAGMALLLIACLPAMAGALLGSALVIGLILSSWIILLGSLCRPSRIFAAAVIVVSLSVAGHVFSSFFLWRANDNSSRWKWRREVIQPIPSETGPLGKPAPFESAYGAWASRQSEAPSQIVLVAAAGGGLRASYWTSLILAEATDRAPSLRRKFFAASGVSGGSLGLAVYRSSLQQPEPHCTGATAKTALVGCVTAFHERDFLAAPMAALTTSSVLNAVLPVRLFPSPNRALEGLWETSWLLTSGRRAPGDMAAPFLDPTGTASAGPLLLLNATSARSGNRLIASQLEIGPWMSPQSPCAANLGQETPMRLSTAAGVSARFPGLSEPAWFLLDHPPGNCRHWQAAVDGGYFDNFGADALRNLLERLGGLWGTSAHPRVIVIQITSDPDFGTNEEGALEAPEKIQTEADQRWLFSPAAWAVWRKGYWQRYYRATSSLLDMQMAAFGLGPEAQPAAPGILLSARNIAGPSTIDRLRLTAEAQPFLAEFYHFSMAGASKTPLSWSLSSGARHELDATLVNPRNAAEMDRLVKSLNSLP